MMRKDQNVSESTLREAFESVRQQNNVVNSQVSYLQSENI